MSSMNTRLCVENGVFMVFELPYIQPLVFPPSVSPLFNFFSSFSLLLKSVRAPISRLDPWKRLCNFLEDYRDGFIQYQSGQLRTFRNNPSPMEGGTSLSGGQRGHQKQGGRKRFQSRSLHAFFNPSTSPPAPFKSCLMKNMAVKTTCVQLYETCSCSD